MQEFIYVACISGGMTGGFIVASLFGVGKANDDLQLSDENKRLWLRVLELTQSNNRRADLIGGLQAKLDAIADATRDGQSGTARMIYRMTGRGK